MTPPTGTLRSPTGMVVTQDDYRIIKEMQEQHDRQQERLMSQDNIDAEREKAQIIGATPAMLRPAAHVDKNTIDMRLLGQAMARIDTLERQVARLLEANPRAALPGDQDENWLVADQIARRMQP